MGCYFTNQSLRTKEIKMHKTEIVNEHCNPRDKNVSLVKKAMSEISREGAMSWRIKRCLAKDRNCEKIGCTESREKRNSGDILIIKEKFGGHNTYY
jgi:hypothetical protein